MQKRTKLKHQLHQKKQIKYRQHVVNEINRRKPLGNRISMLNEMPYPVDVSAKDLTQYYNEYVLPVVNTVKNLPVDYNPNDNRVLLNEADLIQVPDGRSLFGGFVISAGYRLIDNDVRVQILLKDVYGLVKAKNGNGQFVKLTDHVWLDMNNYKNDFLEDLECLEIGLGDYMLFGGQVSQYKGTYNHLKFTKFDIANITLLNCGFPKLESNTKHELVSLNMRKCVSYMHHNHFILKLYNKLKFPNAFPVFGDQISGAVQHFQNDPKYHFGNYKSQVIRPVLVEGFKFEGPYYLHFHGQTLYWSQDKTDAVGDNIELKRVGLAKFYQRLINKYHLRYERYTLPAEDIELAQNPKRLQRKQFHIKQRQQKLNAAKKQKQKNPPKSWINNARHRGMQKQNQKDD